MKNNLERYKIRCAVYLFLIKDGKIFLIRRRNTGWEDGKYGVPAGHLEPGETVKEAAIREAKEEAGIEINIKHLDLVHTMHRRANFEYIDLFFVVNKWQGEPKNKEEDKADDGNWFPITNLPENILLHLEKALNDYKNNITFSEYGF